MNTQKRMEFDVVMKLFLVLVITMCSACGFTAGGLKNDHGYAELNYPDVWQADEEINLSLGPTLLNFAGWAARQEQEDEAIQELLQGLKGVRIRVYKLQNSQQDVAEKIKLTSKALGDEGWQQIISVIEADSRVAIMLKTHEDLIQGLVVLSADAEEAVFINLIGEISTESLVKLGQRKHIDKNLLSQL